MNIDDFFRDTRFNTYFSWLLTAAVLTVFVESFLDTDLLWMMFSGLSMAVILIPPVAHRNPRVMLPWEVLIIAAMPIIVRTFQISALANEVATYVSLAALALIIAVEIHVFTSVRFNHSFAIGFTVVSTLAIAGIWALIRYQMDIYLGTGFLSTNEALMKEFINVMIAGLFAGTIFDVYFQRRDKQFRKLVKKVISK
ncbi:MAG: hypothetical protein ACI977_000190 [Candidatus Nanohaloarchaea archaeon]|jgi:hypothetical protein